MDENHIEILLVEDNPDDVELTLHAFTKHKLTNRIHAARDGQEAIDYIFGSDQGAEVPNHTPKVVLLDLKLPKVDGIEVLRRLKTDARTADIPVVVLTSSREDRDLAACYELGANSYIVKPVDFEQFTEAVRVLGKYWLLLNEPPPP
jgi:two-component system, response regulator